jgi:tRNA modification GTPase
LSRDHNTVFALSSGRLPAAIGVIRISGPGARLALLATCGRVPEPRRAMFARLRDPSSQELIDEALVLWFPAPNSETGEDMAELQVHGGRAIVARLFDVLGRLEGFRLAEAGEFTRRAFENGRLDLTAVEGLADLIDADTEAQRQQAFRQFRGLLGNRAETWRGQLIDALALMEAGIDFSDEEVPTDLALRAFEIICPLAAEIRQAGAGQGERLREGLRVAIAGPPNVGKSTLLNRLARREAAIVSPHAGTTRDVIEVHLDLAGFPVTLRDTAGLREAADPVEREGVRRAWDAVTDANLVLWVVDAAAVEAGLGLAQPPATGGNSAEHWVILNKTDLLAPGAAQALASRFVGRLNGRTLLTISAFSGAGVDDLVLAVTKFAERFFTAEPALVTRERHRVALREAIQALDGALRLGPQAGEELVAEHIRLAMRALERLTGRIGVEDILDVIFRDFCIGK